MPVATNCKKIHISKYYLVLKVILIRNKRDILLLLVLGNVAQDETEHFVDYISSTYVSANTNYLIDEL